MPEYAQRINGNGHRPKADASEIADAMRPKAEEAQAIPGPDSIGVFHAESQTDEAVNEQEKAYEGNAEKEAAPPEKTAAALSYQAGKAKNAGDRQDALAEGEHKRLEMQFTALSQHCRRRVNAALVYWFTGLLLILGDVAGASGAILLLGEQVFNAFAQATSVAVSAVILGVVGTEVRHWVAAKAREKPRKNMTKEEKACESFFTGPDSLAAALKILALIFVAGVLAIVVGLFTLRRAAEGEEIAIAFGCFAFALCMASFLRSYEYACEVSDFLAGAEKRLNEFEKGAARATANPVIADHAGAAAEIESIRARNKAEGDAAGHGFRREMYERFQKRPDIFGHGTPPASAGGAKGTGGAGKEGGS